MITLSSGAIAVCDESDLEMLLQYNWYELKGRRTSYARTGKDGGNFMHHLLIGKPYGDMVVDHIDNNGLNNRRDNLRIITNAENISRQAPRGKIKEKGVIHVPRHKTKPYKVELKVESKRYQGYFASVEEAVAARDSFLAGFGLDKSSPKV